MFLFFPDFGIFYTQYNEQILIVLSIPLGHYFSTNIKSNTYI